MTAKRPRSPRNLWAYSYQIVPPQQNRRLNTIRQLLDQENSTAQREARTWAGRLVLERASTRILIVSDGPEQNRGIDRRLEAELNRLKVEFSRTASMVIPLDRAKSCG